MSHLVCPLCAKSTSLRTFPPEDSNVNIFVHAAKGLGRGRGFRFTKPESIVGNPAYEDVCREIAFRTIKILRLLVKSGVIGKNLTLDMLGMLDYKVSQPAKSMSDEHAAKTALIEEKNTEIRRTREEYDAKLASAEEGVDDLLRDLGLNASWYRSLDGKLDAVKEKIGEFERKADSLLMRLRVPLLRYRGLEAKLDGIDDELGAYLALRE